MISLLSPGLARPTLGAPGRHHSSPPRHPTPLPVILSPPQLICAPAGWRPPLHRASLHLPPTLQQEHTTMHNNSEAYPPADKEYTTSYLSDNTLPPFPELKIPEFYASNCNNELLEMEKIANQIKITALLVKTIGNETSLRTLYNCLQGYRAIINVLKNRIAPGKQDQEGILYRADTRKNWIRNLELLELRNRTVLLNSNKVKLFTNSLTNTYLSIPENTKNKPNPCTFSGHSEQTRGNQPLDRQGGITPLVQPPKPTTQYGENNKNSFFRLEMSSLDEILKATASFQSNLVEITDRIKAKGNIFDSHEVALRLDAINDLVTTELLSVANILETIALEKTRNTRREPSPPPSNTPLSGEKIYELNNLLTIFSYLSNQHLLIYP